MWAETTGRVPSETAATTTLGPLIEHYRCYIPAVVRVWRLLVPWFDSNAVTAGVGFLLVVQVIVSGNGDSGSGFAFAASALDQRGFCCCGGVKSKEASIWFLCA